MCIYDFNWLYHLFCATRPRSQFYIFESVVLLSVLMSRPEYEGAFIYSSI